MKPRNKYERHIVELSDSLPKLSNTQRKYAIEHCFDHLAVKRNGVYHCLDCGSTFDPTPDDGDTLVCPHCGHKLKLEVTRKKKWFVISSFQIVTTAADECQVTRLYYLRKYFTVGEPARYWMDEAVRVFITPGKDDVVIARPLNYNGYYCDSYSFSKELSIKGKNPYNSYGYNTDAYFASGNVVYPYRKVLPILKRNGYSRAIYDFSTIGIIKSLLDNPKIETIVKAGRIDILRGMDEYQIGEYWWHIKMCIRHNYYPKDFTIWRDTINMADKLHLDTHSPKYVLPDNLNQLHDRLSRKLLEIELRKSAEKAAKENKQYEKEHGMVLGVVIVENDMEIKPLQNKLEFLEEGKAMNHCVATYFNNKKSLILSVRVKESGKRLATVELSMKDFSIKQCRCQCNAKPERYDEICSVINAHRPDYFKAIAKGYQQL
jgi:DNA-directed RNA polymerase subunit RPC12/RpoP